MLGSLCPKRLYGDQDEGREAESDGDISRMTRVFHKDEAIKVPNPDGVWHRWICPDCKDHVQGEPREVLDCKNVFKDDEHSYFVGQCCCWSEVHGKRE